MIIWPWSSYLQIRKVKVYNEAVHESVESSWNSYRRITPQLWSNNSTYHTVIWIIRLLYSFRYTIIIKMLLLRRDLKLKVGLSMKKAAHWCDDVIISYHDYCLNLFPTLLEKHLYITLCSAHRKSRGFFFLFHYLWSIQSLQSQEILISMGVIILLLFILLLLSSIDIVFVIRTPIAT